MRLIREIPKRTIEALIQSVRPTPDALTVQCPACGSISGERCQLRMPGWPGGNAMYTVIYQDTPHKDRLALAERQAR